jgi:hypothetical protein
LLQDDKKTGIPPDFLFNFNKPMRGLSQINIGIIASKIGNQKLIISWSVSNTSNLIKTSQLKSV